MKRLTRALGLLMPSQYRCEILNDLLDEHDAMRRRGHGRALAGAWLLSHAIRSAIAARLSLLRDAALPSPRLAFQALAAISGDIRFALRLLARQPAFAIAMITTLAIGIGANTAIYSLLDAVLLNPVRAERADRLVELRETSTYPAYRTYAERMGVFEDLAVWAGADVSIGLPEDPDVVTAGFVSGSYFPLLGATAAFGRLLTPADDAPGLPPVAVISHRMWRQAFAADERILGRSIRVNARMVDIVGVAPERFRGTSLGNAADLWLPVSSVGEIRTGAMGRLPLLESHDIFWLRVVGRLKAGVSIAQADAAVRELRREMGGPLSRFPAGAVVPIRSASLGLDNEQALRRFMFLLSAVAVCSLLVCSVNVANLLLASTLMRDREFALRVALGASRRRVLGQLLTENLVLAVLAAALGVPVAFATLRLLSAFQLPGGIVVDSLGLAVDRTALAVALLTAVASALVFGTVPMFRARAAGAAALRSASRATPRSAARNVLIAAQTALCVALLAGGGLFYRAIQRALALDPGVDVERLAVGAMDLGLERYSPAAAVDFYDTVAARLNQVPGVEGAAWSTVSPTGGGWNLWFEFEGRSPDDGGVIDLQCVSPGYFRTVGTALLNGRTFDAAEDQHAPLVAVINQTTARRFFAGADPIGKRLRLGSNFRRALRVDDSWATVVGIVGDSRHRGLDQAHGPLVYLSRQQISHVTALESASLIVRAADPASILDDVRTIVRSIDPRLPLRVETLTAVTNRAVRPQRLGLALLGAFGAIALVLSAVGVYGVCAFVVSQRRREIGIRLALGAAPADVRRLVLRVTAIGLIAGVVIGLAVASWSGRYVQAFLYGVSPSDPLTLTAVSATLLTVGLAASLLPAHRASRIDPLEVLRAE